jgi:oxaloacetate decarboxylase alpha subunit
LADELDSLTNELEKIAHERSFPLCDEPVDDVLTYALFAQTALKFLENRGNPDAFEPALGSESETAPSSAPADATGAATSSGLSVYDVRVNGRAFTVEVAESGQLASVAPAAAAPVSGEGEPLTAGLAGTVFKVLVNVGDTVNEGQPVLVVEAMKMETEVSASRGGTVTAVHVKEGDAVAVGQPLLDIG